MKKDYLSDAIGQLDEAVIEEALQARSQRPHSAWKRWVAVAACLCILAGCLLALPLLDGGGSPATQPDVSTSPDGDMSHYTGTVGPTTTTTTQRGDNSTIPSSGTPLRDVKVLSLATYPAMAKRPPAEEYGITAAYEQWWEEKCAQRDQLKGHTGGMTAFYADTMEAFLVGDPGENRVYSPLNVYLALAMLAESAEGTSRQQILDLLGVSGLSALRQKCSGLWNGVYLNDGAVTCRLANSLWLAEGDRWKYDTATAKAISEHYYASTYKGVMGSEMYDRVLQGWLNDQTDGLLQQQAEGLQFDPDTALALASTVCFRAKWTEYFNADATESGTFHAATGDVPCDFMQRDAAGFAYYADRFTAVRLGLDDGAYAMTFFLPDKGVSAYELAGDSQVLDVLQKADQSALSKFAHINMSIPRFDVVSDRDLAEGLRGLGITDAFDPQVADFSGILTADNEPVYLSQVKHAARVAIDEEGVTAAAYTVDMLCGTGAPLETLDFTVDRPFLFAITGPGETILFTGIVETP